MVKVLSRDPKARLRLKTAIKTSITVILSSLFVFIHGSGAADGTISLHFVFLS
jgi:hypothetical protein